MIINVKFLAAILLGYAALFLMLNFGARMYGDPTISALLSFFVMAAAVSIPNHASPDVRWGFLKRFALAVVFLLALAFVFIAVVQSVGTAVDLPSKSPLASPK
jgi:hypothetical protein